MAKSPNTTCIITFINFRFFIVVFSLFLVPILYFFILFFQSFLSVPPPTPLRPPSVFCPTKNR